MAGLNEKHTESRRGNDPAEEDYLARIGDRLRLERSRKGMSRKMLSLASGVSERYLAEMERGAGNASLLVVRRLAEAIGLSVAELTTEAQDQAASPLPVDKSEPADLATARAMRSRAAMAPAAVQRARIALIGLRGAGKSTLGAKLASSLDVPFVELDQEIERSSGMEVAEIFASFGEAEYRRIEHQCLQQALTRHVRCVIATGGSLVAEAATFALLRSQCFVVWLHASSQQHRMRVAANDASDTAPSLPSLQPLMRAREPLYGKADAALDTGAVTEHEAMEQLIALVALRG